MQLNKDNANQFLDLFIDTSYHGVFEFNNAEFKHSDSKIVNFFSEIFSKKSESTIVKTLGHFDDLKSNFSNVEHISDVFFSKKKKGQPYELKVILIQLLTKLDQQ